jgi:hypothetical protein
MSYLDKMEELVSWFFLFFNLPDSFLGYNFKQKALEYLRENPSKCYWAYIQAQKILLK